MKVAFVLFFYLLGNVWGYDEGGPRSVCPDPVPWHGAMPQTSTSPITITAPASYTLNGTLQVKISGTKSFEGFMLGAKRIKGDTEELIGSWVSCTGGPTISKQDWYSKTGVTGNCITHAKDSSTNSMTCNWKAPSLNAGDIYFRAAIVSDERVFWLNVKSSTVKAPSVLSSPASYTSTYSGDLTTAACGSTKGCVTYPRGCSGTSCRALVVYSISGTNLDVSMTGKASGYISLGFSSDAKMGNDETFTCAVNPNNKLVEVQRGINVGYFNLRMRYTAMTGMQGKSANGYITCRFVIPLTTTASYYNPRTKKTISLTFTKSNAQHIFFAVGGLWPSTSAVQKHVQLPLKTGAAIDLKLKTSHVFESLPIPVKVHGGFMILAWFGLALPFAQLPAHMRNNIGMSPMWRSWIRLHIGGMLSTVILACAGVITALAFRKGIAKEALIHAILGIIGTVLGIVQVVMGILRPHPGTPKKPIFDLAHLINATCITVFSVVTIFLGFNMQMANPYFGMVMNIIIGITVLFNIVFIILFRVRRQVVFNNEVKKVDSHEEPMKEVGGSSEDVKTEPAANPAPARPQMTTHLPSVLYIIYVAINSVLILIAIILLFLF